MLWALSPVPGPVPVKLGALLCPGRQNVFTVVIIKTLALRVNGKLTGFVQVIGVIEYTVTWAVQEVSVIAGLKKSGNIAVLTTMVLGVITVPGMRYIDQELFTTEVVQEIPVILIGTSKLTMMLHIVGRVVMNTVFQVVGNRGVM